jgi:hypothetical protein
MLTDHYAHRRFADVLPHVPHVLPPAAYPYSTVCGVLAVVDTGPAVPHRGRPLLLRDGDTLATAWSHDVRGVLASDFPDAGHAVAEHWQSLCEARVAAPDDEALRRAALVAGHYANEASRARVPGRRRI